MSSLLGWISFIIAFVSGFLAWIAKNVWRDRERTNLFAMIGIISALAFMIWAWFYSGL